MQTLSQLQARQAGNDAQDAIAAANELTNYFIVYNAEYNTLIQKRQEAESALFDASHDPNGVDHAEVLHLQALILRIESRMKVLDAKMIAFMASTLAIDPPDVDLVKQVKQITAVVAVLVARDQAIQAILKKLGEIAKLVDKVQGA